MDSVCKSERGWLGGGLATLHGGTCRERSREDGTERGGMGWWGEVFSGANLEAAVCHL